MTSEDNDNIDSTMKSSERRKCAISLKTRVLIALLVLVVIIVVVITIVVVLYVIPSTASNEDQGEDVPDSRYLLEGMDLPKTLIPINYYIEIKPLTFENGDDIFLGYVRLAFNCVFSTRYIILHSVNLVLDENSTRLEQVNNNPRFCHLPYIIGSTINSSREVIVFQLDAPLTVGCQYAFSTNYTGKINSNSRGLYKSFYYIGDQQRHIIVSLFSPFYSRMAFPCFDEPSFKATFTICLVRKPFMSSLTNSPIKMIQQRPGDYMADIHETSIPMSTYLVAFVFHEFPSFSSTTTTGVTVRVFSQSSLLFSTQRALQFATKLLPFYEDYLQQNSSLKKLDLVAVPDFLMVAMENIGLLIFRENTIVLNDDALMAEKERKVALLISHEIVHQWFGNIVTAYWWNDIWLTEGITTYFAFAGMAFIYNSSDMDKLFIEGNRHKMMNLDSETAIDKFYYTKDIFKMYDSVTYYKAACLIHMLKGMLGKDLFKKGIIEYLKKYRNRYVTRYEFYEVMMTVAKTKGKNFDMESLMESWLGLPNYPVVTVTVDWTQNTIHLQQNSQKTKNYLNQNRWSIPISYTRGHELDFSMGRVTIFWPNITTMSLPVSHDPVSQPDGHWILVNVQNSGYYRVNYDVDNWRSLAEQLRRDHTKIHVLNRDQMIWDSFILARNGQLDPLIALDVIGYIHKEREFLPIRTSQQILHSLRTMISSNKVHKAFQQFQLKVFKGLYSSSAWNLLNNTYEEKHLKILTVQRSCYYGLSECVDAAKNQFMTWKLNPGKLNIPADFRLSVFCSALRFDENWNFYYSQFKSKQNLPLQPLACTSNMNFIKRFFSEKPVWHESPLKFIAELTANPVGRDMAFDYMTRKMTDYRNWDIISAVVKNFNTVKDLRKVKAFFSQLKIVETHESMKMASIIARIERRINTSAIFVKPLKQWLQHQLDV